MKKMKQLHIFKGYALTFLMMVGLFLGMTGCNESDPPMVSVSKEIIRVDAESQSVSLTIMSNVDWSASCNSSWVKLSKNSGRGTTNIDVIIEDYADVKDRSAVINITASGSTASVQIIQGAVNSILLVAPDAVTVGCDGESVAFAVASNADWTVSSSVEWAVPSVKSGNGNAVVKVKIAENTSHSETRDAVISIISGSDVSERIVKTVTVYQLSRALPSLVMGQSAVSFDALAKTEGTNTVILQSITNITGAITASCDFSWCNAVYLDGKLTITVEDNNTNSARQSIVSVMGDVNGESVMAQVLVYQAGLGSPEILLSRSSVTLNAYSGNLEAAEQKVNVAFTVLTSGTKVAVVEDYPGWISNVGIKNDILSFTVARNELISSRNAVISLVATLGSETLIYPISVTQSGEQEMTASLSEENVSFTYDADTTAVGFFCNVEGCYYNAYVSDGADWCSVKSGNNISAMDVSASIFIYAVENLGYDARTATIVVFAKSADQVVFKTISVTQAGVGTPNVSALQASITLPKDAVEYSDMYRIFLSGVDDRTSVDLYSSDSWISAVLDAGNGHINFKAEANPYSASRKATITLVATKGGESQVIVISVTQSGSGSAALLLSSTEYTFSRKGGILYNIDVEKLNGTEYSIVSSPDWLIVTKDETVYSHGFMVRTQYIFTAGPRSGKIIILAVNGDDSAYYTIYVKQEGLGSPEIEPVASNVVIPARGTPPAMPGEVVSYNPFAVRLIGSNNIYYALIETADEVKWLATRASTDNKYVYINADRNTAVEDRTATVTVIAEFGGETITATFTVTQLGTGSAGLDFYMNDYNITSDEQTLGVSYIRLNNSEYSIESMPSWISINSSHPSRILFNVSQNVSTEARTGEIVFKVTNGDDILYQSVVVNQAAMDDLNLVAIPSSIVLAQSASSVDIKRVVLTNVDATATYSYYVGIVEISSSGWLSYDISAMPDHLIVYANSTNMSSESRTSIITIHIDNGAEEQIINIPVTQLGTGSAGLDLSNDVLYFGYEASSYNLTALPVNGSSFSVVSSSGWITATSGTGNILNISVTKNMSNYTRTGTVVLLASNGDDNILYTINVVQSGIEGPAISMLFDNSEVPAEGCSKGSTAIGLYPYKIRIIDEEETDIATIIPDDADWLLAEVQNDGMGGKYLIITSAAANTSSKDRIAQVAVVATRGTDKQISYITVKQSGVGQPECLFPAGREFTYDYQSHDQVFVPVDYNEHYEISNITAYTPEGASPSYLTLLEAVTGGFKFKLNTNYSSESRTATIYVTLKVIGGTESETYKVIINQLGTGELSVVPSVDEINLGADSGTYHFILEGYNSLYTVYSLITGDDLTFINPIDLSSGLPIVSFTYNANTGTDPRCGYIYILTTNTAASESITHCIKVNQAGADGPSVTMPVKQLSACYNGSCFTFKPLNVNGSLSVSLDSEWLLYYLYDGNIIVYVGKNTTQQERIGHVTVTSTLNGKSVSEVIKITQACQSDPQLIIGNNFLLTGYKGGSYKIPCYFLLSNDCSVLICSSDRWLSGTDILFESNLLTVKTTDNTTGAIRTGVIYIMVTTDSGIRKLYTITVRQNTVAADNTIEVYTPDTGEWNSETATLTLDKNKSFAAITIPVKNTDTINDVYAYAPSEDDYVNVTWSGGSYHFYEIDASDNIVTPMTGEYYGNIHYSSETYGFTGVSDYSNYYTNIPLSPCKCAWLAFDWSDKPTGSTAKYNLTDIPAGVNQIMLAVWSNGTERTGYVTLNNDAGVITTITIVQK